MNYNEIMSLVNAGFTKDEILKLAGMAPAPDPESEKEKPVDYTYIGNKNSKVFHQSNCGSVTRMKDKNKVPFGSRDAAISAGYDPCDNCTP